ncbi:MAG: hypothetical protein WB441_16305 [Nocardioidaceae bacterium]
MKPLRAATRREALPVRRTYSHQCALALPAPGAGSLMTDGELS